MVNFQVRGKFCNNRNAVARWPLADKATDAEMDRPPRVHLPITACLTQRPPESNGPTIFAVYAFGKIIPHQCTNRTALDLAPAKLQGVQAFCARNKLCCAQEYGGGATIGGMDDQRTEREGSAARIG